MYFTFTPFRKKETKELSSVVLQRAAAQIAKSKVICAETFGYLIIVLVFKFGATYFYLILCVSNLFYQGYINITVDNGSQMITLDASIFYDVINNSENRNLCNELIRARLSLASNGDHNNIPIIDQILKLRFDKAKLLGYKNYAEVCFYFFFFFLLFL